jgi:ubiquinone/menaquinone biosynthesis C-methylase UbiE
MGFYASQILPRAADLAMRSKEYAPPRARITAGLAGEVLEIGFGSGLNVRYYPPGVKRVLAVEPSAVGRKLAARRVAASSTAVEYVGADAQALPLQDASVDHVVSSWTLCTIPDVDRALAEIRRVLRPGGSLHFVEHGRSPDGKVARAQDRLTPFQRRLAGGCHLNRPIDRLLVAAGLELTRLDNYYLSGPRAWVYTFEGVATKPREP